MIAQARQLSPRNVGLDMIPAPTQVLLAIVSVQIGAALTKGLLAGIGPGGAVFLRSAFGALILLLFWRPPTRGYTRATTLTILAFGLVLAGMNFAFYSALELLPLGAAVTLEFVGPLGVALLSSRRPLDFCWGALAAAGIVLLGPLNTGLDPRGIAWALLAGLMWGAYIPLSARMGRAFSGGRGLTVAMGVAALATMPLGVGAAGAQLLDARLLLVGAGVALLSSALPYALELSSLRRLPARTFGVLLSLEPAVGAVVGVVALGEALNRRAVTAIVLVILASLGATLSARRRAAVPSPQP